MRAQVYGAKTLENWTLDLGDLLEKNKLLLVVRKGLKVIFKKKKLVDGLLRKGHKFQRS